MSTPAKGDAVSAPEEPPVLPRSSAVLGVVLAVLGVVLALLVVSSLWWRASHDTPIFQFIGWEIRVQGAVPYRDLFDPNPPGTHLFYAAVGAVTGDTDLGLRIFDVVWALGLGAVLWRLVRPFGINAAALACVCSGLLYFGQGATMSFQRDYICVLPIAGAALVACRRRGQHAWGAVGLLVGAAATVKPQLAIVWPVLLLHLDHGIKSVAPSQRIRLALVSVLGFATPVAVAIGWVAARGGFDAMVEVFTEYNPLYLSLDGEHRVIEDRLAHTASGLALLGGYWGLVALAVVARVGVARRDPALIGDLRLLLRLTIALAVAPAVAGQMWDYHWMPFALFATCLAAIGVTRATAAFPTARSVAPAALLLVLLVTVARVPLETRQQLGLTDRTVDSLVRADEVAAFLREHLRPGEEVQPLDWVNGAAQGMLLARAPLATSFVYDTQFFHDVSEPVIQSLRRRFIAELEIAQPRFIIQVTAWFPRVTGPDTDPSFPELDRFLEGYDIVHVGNGWRAWERSDTEVGR